MTEPTKPLTDSEWLLSLGCCVLGLPGGHDLMQRFIGKGITISGIVDRIEDRDDRIETLEAVHDAANNLLSGYKLICCCDDPFICSPCQLQAKLDAAKVAP